MKTILLNWHLSNTFGWGLLGLNIFSHWANDPDLLPLVSGLVGKDDLEAMDPLRYQRIIESIKRSNRTIIALEQDKPARIDIAGVVIDPLGNGLDPSHSHYFGQVNIGRCIFESTRIEGARQKLAKYDVLLCGSHWNADVVQGASGRAVEVILEGIDPSLFCPGPRSGMMDASKFYIFTGGKIEFRKAQDLVLSAFKRFSSRHSDAILVTAWHSPWPEFSLGFQGTLAHPIQADDKGALDIKKWVADNGIDPRQIIEIGPTPNHLMPTILREMDVALQPSRAEACTNLPVKEAMACGVPVIVADNTGMRDLITPDNCVALKRQGLVTGPDPSATIGWGESDVEEIVHHLEQLYSDTQRRRDIGGTAAAWVREHRTWQRHAEQLKRFACGL